MSFAVRKLLPSPRIWYFLYSVSILPFLTNTKISGPILKSNLGPFDFEPSTLATVPSFPDDCVGYFEVPSALGAFLFSLLVVQAPIF